MTNPRRDGFAGQHFVVVPSPIRTAARRHPLLRGLLVTDAGFFPAAAGHRVEREKGAPTHLMIVCLQGRGWVNCENRSITIEAGDLLWLPPDKRHAYGADEGRPWTIIYAHFMGEEADAWRAEIDQTSDANFAHLRLGEAGSMLGFDRIYAKLEEGYSTAHLLAASTLLRTVFCAVLDAKKRTGALRSASERTAAVRQQLEANPERRYQLRELAAAAGLSVPHFTLLFRQNTGYAPIEFLTRLRISRACRMLDTTQGSVTAIASECGFEDPYYFSRCFRRIMGIAPRDFRKRVKG